MVFSEIFLDFPENLPESLQTVVQKVPEVFVKVASKLADLPKEYFDKHNDGVDLGNLDVDFAPYNSFEEIYDSPLYSSVLALFLAQVNLGISQSTINYERLLYQQELIMMFAHLDAFIADTLRIICQARPEMLKRKKSIEWSTILSCGGWQELMDFLVEQFVYEFGWPPLRKRLKMMDEQLGIQISYPDYDFDISLLEEAENIRHILVHNGGRVSKEYIDRVGQYNLQVGDYIPLTFDYLEDVLSASRILVGELFLSVSEKFFGLDPLKITGVWRRSNEIAGEEQ